jgi:hypothetical protein
MKKEVSAVGEYVCDLFRFEDFIPCRTFHKDMGDSWEKIPKDEKEEIKEILERASSPQKEGDE